VVCVGVCVRCVVVCGVCMCGVCVCGCVCGVCVCVCVCVCAVRGISALNFKLALKRAFSNFSF